MTLASFNSSPKFAFMASEKYARNREGEEASHQILGVFIDYLEPGPLSFGRVGIDQNRGFMQSIFNKLIETPYPDPSPFSTIASIDTYECTVVQNPSGTIATINYTKIVSQGIGSDGHWYLINNESVREFLFARCCYSMKPTINATPVRYKRIRASKLKIGLVSKRFPICVSRMINGAQICNNSAINAPGSGEGYVHSGPTIELSPPTPDFGTIIDPWYGARRLDLYANTGGGSRDSEDPNLAPTFEIGPTPTCCAI